jgi:HSP20 family protein
VANGGDPHVEEDHETARRQFEQSAHGYDCRMPSRKDIDRLKSEMEELFVDLCQARLGAHRAGFRPRVDVYRTEDPAAVNVVVELPGIDASEVQLSVADGVLAVSGRRRRDIRQRRWYQHMEIDYGPFERRVVLGEDVDADAAEASYDSGVLTVVLPLARKPSGPVRVTVTRGEAT